MVSSVKMLWDSCVDILWYLVSMVVALVAVYVEGFQFSYLCVRKVDLAGIVILPLMGH